MYTNSANQILIAIKILFFLLCLNYKVGLCEVYNNWTTHVHSEQIQHDKMKKKTFMLISELQHFYLRKKK